MLTSLNLHGDVKTFVAELSCQKKPLEISDMFETVSIIPTSTTRFSIESYKKPWTKY